MKDILNTDWRTFLVKFQFQSTNGMFIVKFDGLPECLKKGKHGIDYIKEFDPVDAKFKRVSKKEIIALYEDTEHEEYINNHYYFKKR